MLNYAQKSYLSENYGTAVALICHASHGGTRHAQQRSLRAGRNIIFLAPRLFSGFPRLSRTPLLDLPCLALKPLLVQRGITLRLLADAADFIAVALPSVQDKGYAQYGYNYYRHDYSNQRAASYIHNIIAA